VGVNLVAIRVSPPHAPGSWQTGEASEQVMRGNGPAVTSQPQRPQRARSLARLPGWRVVCQDRAGLVLARQARP
jgi:hypothetical protein